MEKSPKLILKREVKKFLKKLKKHKPSVSLAEGCVIFLDALEENSYFRNYPGDLKYFEILFAEIKEEILNEY
jgi:hypothetical protein